MKPLVVTSTSCNCKSLIAPTYESFQKHLKGVDWDKSTLILNVDNVPKRYQAEEVVAEARRFFPTVISQIKEPCFPAAVKWVWSQVPDVPHHLHLEADWELREDVAIEEIEKRLQPENIFAVNFQCYGFKGKKPALLPGLWKTTVTKDLASRITDDLDPEMQIRKVLFSDEKYKPMTNDHYPHDHKVVYDIGRQWRQDEDVAKNTGGNNYFTAWVERPHYELSILILTLESRQKFLDRLLEVLRPQLVERPVELLINSDDGTRPIGLKRQELLESSHGRFVAFVDDDDLVNPRYVDIILNAIKTHPNATHCSLKGEMSLPTGLRRPFEHSTKYKKWETLGRLYARTPNHLNAIRRTIAMQVGYHFVNFGEDKDYSDRLQESGLLGEEAYIEDVLYYYMYMPKPRSAYGR